jgi:hypothetical protein
MWHAMWEEKRQSETERERERGGEKKERNGERRNFALVCLKSDGDTGTGTSFYTVRIVCWEVARRLWSL